MYTENLVTPHPESSAFTSYDAQRPLLEVANPTAERAFIANAPDKQAATLEVTSRLSTAVKRTLRWEEGRWPVVEDLGQQPLHAIVEPTTNCIGYWLVMSELLSQSGIENYALTIGGHFLNAIITEKEKRKQLYMIEIVKPAFSQYLTERALGGAGVESILEQLDTNPHPRAAFRVWTDELIRGAQMRPDELFQGRRFNWLYHEGGSTTNLSKDDRYDPNPEKTYLQRYTGFMSIYRADTARRVLPAYATFVSAVTKRDHKKALASNSLMAGLAPELDIRRSHIHIDALIQDLAAANQTEDALKAIMDYCSSFALDRTDMPTRVLESGREPNRDTTWSNIQNVWRKGIDPRLKMLEGNLYDKVVECNPDISTVDAIIFTGLALKAHQEAKAMARISTYNAKVIRKLEKRLATLGEKFKMEMPV